MNLFEELKTKVNENKDGEYFYLHGDIKVARVLSLLLAYLNGRTYEQCESRTSVYPGRIYDMARFMSKESGAPQDFFEKWFLSGNKTFYEIEDQYESKNAMERYVRRLTLEVEKLHKSLKTIHDNKELEQKSNTYQLYTRRLLEVAKDLERALAYKKYME